MAQHVGMDREWQLSGLAKPLYELLTNALAAKRRDCKGNTPPQGMVPKREQAIAGNNTDASASTLYSLDYLKSQSGETTSKVGGPGARLRERSGPFCVPSQEPTTCPEVG
jgi:hypothetical protein